MKMQFKLNVPSAFPLAAPESRTRLVALRNPRVPERILLVPGAGKYPERSLTESSTSGLSSGSQAIDKAIANARTEVDSRGYAGHKAMVETRLNDAVSLLRQYLRERPNEESVRTVLLLTALMLNDRETLAEAIAQVYARGKSSP